MDTFEQIHPPVPMMTMRVQAAKMEAEPVTAEFSPQKVTVTAHARGYDDRAISTPTRKVKRR